MSVRDLCPVHGEPMWHWPAGGDDAYACQRPECEATKPVTQVGFSALRVQHSMDALRYAMLHMPPVTLGNASRSPFSLIATV